MAQIKSNLFYIFLFMAFERKEKNYPMNQIEELDTSLHKLKPQYLRVQKAYNAYSFDSQSKPLMYQRCLLLFSFEVTKAQGG